MDALSLLQKRVSVGKLKSPAPDDAQCAALIQAAIRAADHANLTPWRFLLMRDEALIRLGEVFLAAAKITKPDITEETAKRLLSMPLRAPLIITVIAKTQSHPKIPLHEQLFSAAAAAQNILNAAYALGFGAIWRTGDVVSDAYVNTALGLTQGEQIIGFLYVGTPIEPLEEAKLKAATDFFSYWS